MIPKGLAGIVPIRIVEAVEREAALQIVDAETRQEETVENGEQAHVLVIDDDAALDFSWQMERGRLGFASIQYYPSMEACEAASIDYAGITHAFLDKNIPDSGWDLKRSISHLKQQGVQRVVIASGERREELLADPQCAQADDVLAYKIPQNDDYFS